jgi:hypothetical protein
VSNYLVSAISIFLVVGTGAFLNENVITEPDRFVIRDAATKLAAVSDELALRSATSQSDANKPAGPPVDDLKIDQIARIANEKTFTDIIKTLDEPALKILRDDLRNFGPRGSERAVNNIGWSLALATFIVVVYLVSFAGCIYAYRLFMRYRIFMTRKAEVGLQSRCQDLLELIKYQSTLASNTELSVMGKVFSGKLTSGKQLADRPLSLPGLTTACNAFLKQIAQVFSNKVVICIDELDKITDMLQLLELLKGIKGLLGQETTHFILTISEDAMSLFNERLSRERSLVESAFEEIIYLDRLSRRQAGAVIRQTLALDKNWSESETYILNCSILWIFSGGVPREINRALFTCYSGGVSLVEASPFDLWRFLYLGMLRSMLATTPVKEQENIEEQYRFLICIETLVNLVKGMSQPLQTRELLHQVIAIEALTPATAFEGRTARGNLGWWWLRVRGRHGP